MNRLLHEVALFTMNAIGMVNLRSSLWTSPTINVMLRNSNQL